MRVAVDFDGVLYHRHNGGMSELAVDYVKARLSQGDEVFVYTCRPDYMAKDIQSMLSTVGLGDLPVRGGKAYYDLLIDDKCVCWPEGGGWKQE